MTISSLAEQSGASAAALAPDIVKAVSAADWRRLRVCLDPDCRFVDPERSIEDAASFLRFEENARAGLRDWQLIDVIADGEAVLLVQRWADAASGPYHKLVRGYTRRYGRDLAVVDRYECRHGLVVGIRRHYDEQAVAAARSIPDYEPSAIEQAIGAGLIGLDAARRLWWVIAICLILCLGGAGTYLRLFAHPLYRSSTEIVIIPHNSDVDLAAQNILQQYATVIDSDQLAEVVQRSLNLPVSPTELHRELHVEAVPAQMLITISIDDPNPRQAQRIVAAWGDAFVKQHELDMKPLDPAEHLDATVADTPSVGTLVWPRTKLILLGSAALGLIASALIIGLVALLDTTIRTEEAARRLRLDVLGRIPRSAAD